MAWRRQTQEEGVAARATDRRKPLSQRVFRFSPGGEHPDGVPDADEGPAPQGRHLMIMEVSEGVRSATAAWQELIRLISGVRQRVGPDRISRKTSDGACACPVRGNAAGAEVATGDRTGGCHLSDGWTPSGLDHRAPERSPAKSAAETRRTRGRHRRRQTRSGTVIGRSHAIADRTPNGGPGPGRRTDLPVARAHVMPPDMGHVVPHRTVFTLAYPPCGHNSSRDTNSYIDRYRRAAR
jgi:hypothetical protein